MFQSIFSGLFISLQLYVVHSLFVAQQSLCGGRSTRSAPSLAHVTDKTATAVSAQGSSLCVIKTPLFLKKLCVCPCFFVASAFASCFASALTFCCCLSQCSFLGLCPAPLFIGTGSSFPVVSSIRMVQEGGLFLFHVASDQIRVDVLPRLGGQCRNFDVIFDHRGMR